MFKNEDDFKKIVSRLDIDTKPNSAHREKLRWQILSAFNKASRQTLRNTIMKSPITKIAAAAVIIVAVVVSIMVFNKSMPAAFGIEQVIDAYNNIRFLHVKEIGADREEPDEFWIKSDEQGRVEKARYYLPVTEDGIKLITWTPEKLELWFKSKRSFLICQSKRVEDWMQSIMEQCQPKLVMEKLLEDQKTGKVDIDIQKPQNRQKPALIVATYKTEPQKEIYYINQATDLITHIEFYRIEDNREVLKSTTKFYDYNVPIDEKMFSLQDEVPKDVRVADQLNQLIGVPQGNMTDEQAAAETVRQFFQALMDKDYKKAGLIVGGELEEYAKEDFGGVDVTAIVSIGPPIPQPDWEERGFRVPCVLKIIAPDGQKFIWKPGAHVRPGDDEMHPDRWNITSGVNVILPTETEFYLRLSNANSAGRFVITGWYDSKLQLRGEVKWLNEPEVLPDNDVYSKMSPDEVVRAFFETFSSQDFNEMRKFMPDSFVEPIKREFEETVKRGEKIEPPTMEVIGEAFWSSEHSAYFVKYREVDRKIEMEPDDEKR